MPDQRTPLPPRDPKRGDLRVEGAPKKPPMLPWSGRRFVAILLALFFLNWLIVSVVAPAEERIQVPYNPNFLAEVRDGNVKEISSRGDTVQGEFQGGQVQGRGGKGVRANLSEVLDRTAPRFDVEAAGVRCQYSPAQSRLRVAVLR